MRLYRLKRLAQILVIELSRHVSCSETATVPTASVATAATTTTITTTITTTNQRDDLFQSGYITPGFKPFS